MSFDPEKVERWDIYPSVDDKDYFFAERVGSETHRSPNAREFVPATEYDQLLALYRDGWIAVTEKLPPNLEPVLVCVQGMPAPNGKPSLVRVSAYDKDQPASMYWHGIIMGYGGGVTHWRPLPTPPSVQP